MSEARPAASGVKKWFCATCIEFKHEDAVFERLYYLMCFDCALCVQDPPPQVCHLSHTSPIYCADPFVATVWRWQCISVCSPIFHGVKDTGIGPQTIIIYEFHHPVHPHRLTVFFFYSLTGEIDFLLRHETPLCSLCCASLDVLYCNTRSKLQVSTGECLHLRVCAICGTSQLAEKNLVSCMQNFR